MRGLVFKGNRRVALEEFSDPIPGPGEVVVAMRASGICGSDLNLYRRSSFDRRVVCGHEPCGVVAERGPGVSERDAPSGQRVMIHHYKNCGQCKQCRPIGQAECAQFVVDHKLPLGSIFTHRYGSLDQAAEAYQLFDTQTTGKGVFLL